MGYRGATHPLALRAFEYCTTAASLWRYAGHQSQVRDDAVFSDDQAGVVEPVCVLAAGDCKIGSLRRRSTKLPNVMNSIACWDNSTTVHLMRAVLERRASIPLPPSRLNAPLAAWASGHRPAADVRAPARPGRSSLAAAQSFLRSCRPVRARARMLHKQPASALHRE